MARPIWTGSLSFGLLNIPIQLMPGERKTDVHFRMLDSRTKDPIRYERINSETGEEVPWKNVAKAYEYAKGSYVVLEESDITAAASDNKEMIALDAFVEEADIGPAYHEKPYLLVPGKKAEKGYVLLREVLKKSKRVGVGRVVIRTREYLSMVTPQDDALMLILLRFPKELVDPSKYKIPGGSASKWKITAREMEMATTLLDSMSTTWDPDAYTDEFRTRLRAAIKRRIKTKGAVRKLEEHAEDMEEGTATNVVDFMALLRKSLEKKGEAKKPRARKTAKKTSRTRPKKAVKRKAG